KLFHWLSKQNLPQLEDETPPSSFYEVLENAEITFHCSNCDKLLGSLHTEQRQRSIATQTWVPYPGGDAAQMQLQALQGAEVAIHTQKQTQKRPKLREIETQTQLMYASKALQTQQTGELLATRMSLSTLTSPPPTLTQRLLSVMLQSLLWLRGRSLWSLFKSLLLCISLLHGGYVLCCCVSRSIPVQRMLLAVQPVAVPPPPPPPPPPPAMRSLPSYIWSQFCRLAHKLYLI
ncbi:hypothetical protein KR222_006215, partial [Zaprionus bogoriensis]